MISFIIAIAVFIIFKFTMALIKDNDDLQNLPLHIKFEHLVMRLNSNAFNGKGTITTLHKRAFNLYDGHSNQIIKFNYSTGHLTITWKYKYFQKEVIHERQFDNVRNLSIFEQDNIADQMINQMEVVILNHQRSVLGK